jgi:hypothetical protein
VRTVPHCKITFNQQGVHCTSKHAPLLSPKRNRRHESDIPLIDVVRNVSAQGGLRDLCAESTNRRWGGELQLAGRYAATRMQHMPPPVPMINMRWGALAPDPREARRWYERARQLGATDAAQRITRLGAQ